MLSEKLSIRAFKEDDARQVVRLHHESSERFEELEITEDFINSIAQRSDFKFFVAGDGEEVTGFIGLLFHVNVGRAEVGPICVNPLHRRRGIGTKLLDYTTNFLKQAGVKRIIAKVKLNNEEAIDFFKANGFVEEGHFKEYTVKGEDVVQLRRFI
ncbi:MAG: GNAT family N-acetyltransferase [Candidatus Altiarchaeota archaeon]|nr:GNAT family N-acetyltransferase [Candidatus Altiarchaeota archaeon]